MIRMIAVIGGGTMGRGIAYLSALSGFDTVIHDADASALEAARLAIESMLATGVEKGKVSSDDAHAALERILPAADLEPAVRDADLIIEAVPEDFDLKKNVFAQADLFCREETIFASNTSSIPISRLAANVERREQFIGMHFFNPPHLMKLVEIVTGERTSQATLESVRAVAVKMGKVPIVVRDSPGFATSRLGLAIGLEAMRMVEEQVATAEDIDRAMELGYNHPMGPLRLTDLVGLDVRLGIAEVLTESLGPRFEPPEILRRMVQEGKLGKKTGEGFYKWES